jgi:hypothetical protein
VVQKGVGFELETPVAGLQPSSGAALLRLSVISMRLIVLTGVLAWQADARTM